MKFRSSFLLFFMIVSPAFAAERAPLYWDPVAHDAAKFADPGTGSFLLPMPQVGAFNLGNDPESLTAFCDEAQAEAKRQLGLDRFRRSYKGSAVEVSSSPMISAAIFRQGEWVRGQRLAAVELLLCERSETNR